MSTKLFGPELYQKLDDEFESKTNSAKGSIRLIRDELLAIADGSRPGNIVGHDYGWMSLHLANFVHTDGTVRGVVLHGWCLRPNSKILDVHTHSFDMKSRAILQNVNNQPVDVQLLGPDASIQSPGVFRVFDAVSDSGGRDRLIDTGRLATAHIDEKRYEIIEEGQQYGMATGDWHRSTIDQPTAAQIREIDFPVSLMISSHRPNRHNLVLDNRPIYPIGQEEGALLPTIEIQRGQYNAAEAMAIAQRYAGALGLGGFN